MQLRPRLLHPAAWWLWGLGLATAASRTTNPVVLLLVIGVCIVVVTERRDPATTNPLWGFLLVGAVIIAFRVVMTMLLGNGVYGDTVLFTLPAGSPAGVGFWHPVGWPGHSGVAAVCRV